MLSRKGTLPVVLCTLGPRKLLFHPSTHFYRHFVSQRFVNLRMSRTTGERALLTPSHSIAVNGTLSMMEWRAFLAVLVSRGEGSMM